MTRRQGFRYLNASLLGVFELPQGTTDGTFSEEREHRLVLRLRKIQKHFHGWRQKSITALPRSSQFSDRYEDSSEAIREMLFAFAVSISFLSTDEAMHEAMIP
ncbi:hypothetical protein [Synechococcus sp. MIT S9510]|uniref:hypothetical protein n=1 Tax=Synechococcus sp. MIT S9510 TaxID=3082548 RepID=UPI0039B00F22